MVEGADISEEEESGGAGMCIDGFELVAIISVMSTAASETFITGSKECISDKFPDLTSPRASSGIINENMIRIHKKNLCFVFIVS